MFGRRRRPVLGAAVVIGASRHAARREVALQNQAASNAELQRRVDQQEQDRRTQQAIDDALAKEKSERERIAEKEERDRAAGAAQRPPPYIIDQNLPADAFFCGACGVLGKRSDTFCSACGRRHPKEVKGGDMNVMADVRAN